jgi:hypothetical protein
MIEQLRKYKEKDTNMETNFLLAHNLYGKATIPPTDKVKLNLLIDRNYIDCCFFIGLSMVRCECDAGIYS